MRPIVESNGVKLYCSNDHRFAFFNSPYPSHKSKTGIELELEIQQVGIDGNYTE